jgi:adenosine deaminase
VRPQFSPCHAPSLGSAGEEAGPGYVWDAIKALGIERIDHGVHSIEDPSLVQYLQQYQLPLTTCPLSNLQLKVR